MKLTVLLYFLVVLVLVMFAPAMLVWAINTVFGTTIVLTFKGWLAMMLFVLIFGR